MNVNIVLSFGLLIQTIFGITNCTAKEPNTFNFEIYEPSFKKVDSFSRPVMFIGIGIHSIGFSPKNERMFAQLYYLDSNNSKLLEGPEVNYKITKGISNIGIMGIRPDNKSFFVSVLEKLFEYDSNLKIKKEISIEEFKFEPNSCKYQFAGFGKASNETLWFGVNKIWLEEGKKWSKRFLSEWDFNKSPSTRLIGIIDSLPEGMTVDMQNHKVFTFGSANSEIYDFKTMKIETAPYSGNYFADFDPNYGLLLSKTTIHSPDEQALIIKYDITKDQKIVVDEGLSAVWGLNGDIYFCDKRKQIWRCSSDGKQRSLFSSGIPKPVDLNVQMEPPKVSNDRTMIAFNYSNGVLKPEEEIVGTVLIDLQEHEYIILHNKSFSYNRMGWLIKDKK
ncbi:MAG: hypothetical protein EHM20_15400 [Alphaproteobacteria bacterium]|nr:MAG: hypothetical protein EHM20_15400 [Alphaproteobacteria bacterium]